MGIGVLIETLWNVKKKQTKDELLALKVLIETLWNVKKDMKRSVSARWEF